MEVGCSIKHWNCDTEIHIFHDRKVKTHSFMALLLISSSFHITTYQTYLELLYVIYTVPYRKGNATKVALVMNPM